MSEQTVMWLDIAAAIATVLLTWELLKGVLKFLGRLWNRTVGARQNQKRLINRLFPGANLQYVDAVLGPATLITDGGSAGRIGRYRLPDCWVSVGEKHGAAEWISITITDPKFVFRTKRHTQGLIDVRLGRDCFDKADGVFRPTAVSIGQKDQRYVEVCDGPTLFRSQKAVLGYTNLGVGNLAIEGEPWSADGAPSAKVVREKTTINSIAMSVPFGDLPEGILLRWKEVQTVPLGRRRALASFIEHLRSRWPSKRLDQ